MLSPSGSGTCPTARSSSSKSWPATSRERGKSSSEDFADDEVGGQAGRDVLDSDAPGIGAGRKPELHRVGERAGLVAGQALRLSFAVDRFGAVSVVVRTDRPDLDVALGRFGARRLGRPGILEPHRDDVAPALLAELLEGDFRVERVLGAR